MPVPKSTVIAFLFLEFQEVLQVLSALCGHMN